MRACDSDSMAITTLHVILCRWLFYLGYLVLPINFVIWIKWEDTLLIWARKSFSRNQKWYICLFICTLMISHLSSFFCSENTKNVLIAASFIHLKHRKHAKYTSELTTVNPRILLSGPTGVWLFYFHCYVLEFVKVNFCKRWNANLISLSFECYL
jgi:hypothetical protein